MALTILAGLPVVVLAALLVVGLLVVGAVLNGSGAERADVRAEYITARHKRRY